MATRQSKRTAEGTGNIGGDAWASYSDLIAGVLLIFILVTVLKEFQIQAAVADPSQTLREWKEAIEELCTDPELQRQNLAPDCETGTIELPDRVFFDTNETELKAEGKSVLRFAIPIILSKLRQQDIVWSNLSIEVRGHADPRAVATRDPYEVNLEKSVARARNVLLFLTSDEGIEETSRQDLKSKGFASGASFSQPPSSCIGVDQESCFDDMRRVEIHLHLDDKQIRRALVALLDEITG